MLPLHYSPWTCWKPEHLEFIAVGVVCVRYPRDTRWNFDPTRITGKAPNIINRMRFSPLQLGIPMFVNIWKFFKDKYSLQSQQELIQAGSILLYIGCLLVLLDSRECMAPAFKSLLADGTMVTYEWKKMEKETKPSGTSNFILFLN